jgi:4'-phosphopantetheinyl transferase EntD
MKKLSHGAMLPLAMQEPTNDLRSRSAPPARSDSFLQAAIEQLAVPGIVIGHRFISPSDETALTCGQRAALPAEKTRRSSGAARVVARELLVHAGYRACPVPKARSGAPVWPRGLVGSLAHDSQVAVAALAPRRKFAAIGIDIEPAEAPPSELINVIATPLEQASLETYLYGGRLLFVAKEAVYKAVASLDRVFLDHADIEIDFAKRRAVVRNGRTVGLRYIISNRLLALAFIRAPAIERTRVVDA